MNCLHNNHPGPHITGRYSSHRALPSCCGCVISGAVGEENLPMRQECDRSFLAVGWPVDSARVAAYHPCTYVQARQVFFYGRFA
jgi:hypothetical protein